MEIYWYHACVTVEKREFLEESARLTFKICADIPQIILFFKSWIF